MFTHKGKTKYLYAQKEYISLLDRMECYIANDFQIINIIRPSSDVYCTDGSNIKIWPHFFFPYVVIKVVHLATTQFQQFVIEIFAMTVNKTVGEFVDAERLKGLFG